jgi:hypothetical protein
MEASESHGPVGMVITDQIRYLERSAKEPTPLFRVCGYGVHFL